MTTIAPLRTTSFSVLPAERLPTGDTEPVAGFAKVVSEALGDTANALKAAEETSAAAMSGKASIQEVVESVMHAERQLQTVLAIRDKVVAAYQELSRTTI